MSELGRLIELRGTVQGVGLRPWVYRVAVDAGVQGRVRNGARGVIIEAYGSPAALERFLAGLSKDRPPAADVAELTWTAIAPKPESEFRIELSDRAGRRSAVIPADLPTCSHCLAEIRDPADRRYGYAFTTCTDCGPRFTIARTVPYDRDNTSMSAFRMCAQCQREYDSPASRRFHAEANACPACGPALALLDVRGRVVADCEPLARAAEALAAGAVVAIKGLGGYHLACDAAGAGAVEELRRRKHREAKPFAVMVENLDTAERLARVSDGARRMLTGPERPIVLLPRRDDAPVAAAVAPGEARLGVFLPYTPLHHLLLERLSRPLVMTSANRADEPTAHRDADALLRLAGIADFFLTHDREIMSRTDDSVAAIVAGEPVVVRRSRGYVPRPVALPRVGVEAEGEGPVVAGLGAHLKNACCVAVGDEAYLGPHVGDLETLEAYESMRASLETMERFLDVRADVLAHDLHPDYLSTRLAREREAVVRIAVQHHHAHVVSAMVEHGLTGPTLGLAWDGGGLGSDGTIWGSELLLADALGFRRLATFRPLRLPGGDLAMREVWRSALAALDDAYDGEPPLSKLPLFAKISDERIALVRRMLAVGLNAPVSHGLGRWIDAAAAIVLTSPFAEYEAQLASRFEQAACGVVAGAYDFDVDASAEPWQVDLRPAIRAVAEDTIAGRSPAEIARRFHGTLAAAGADAVERAIEGHGALPLVASGGCFHNSLIVEGLARTLAGRTPLLPQRAVPPGDGGIALGQAAVAKARFLAEHR